MEARRAQGERWALATVVGGRLGPGRGAGAKLAVNARGEVLGQAGGDAAVVDGVRRAAEEVLQGGAPQLVQFGAVDPVAAGQGLLCAEIELWVQRYEPSRFSELALTRGRAAEVTLLGGAAPGTSIVIEPSGARAGSLGAPELDDEAARLASELIWSEMSERRGTMFVDVLVPPPRLLVFGAADIAACLCTLGRAIGWRVYVIDPRGEASRFGDAEEVVVAWPDEAAERLGGIDPATSVLLLTHDPELDLAALSLALRSPARFIGAMGSRRTQSLRRERILGAGFDESALERVSAPVGLDLGASDSGETALSILAEVVAARHGHAGGRLERGAPIHAGVGA